MAKEGKQGGGVAASSGDTDIDQLLRARSEIDAALQRHKAQFTVLFADVVGSTTFFERYGDTAGLMMLQQHHELVLPAIEEEQGTVIKTIGDAVLAVFGSPVAAVRTAIKIQKRLDSYNEDRPQAERIYTRVGLNFGSGFVKARDVFGDVVNTAARFVKACVPAQILISRGIYEAVQKHRELKCRALGSAIFHGKSAAEEIYEVLWTTEARYQRLRQQLDAGPGAARSVLGRYEILDELGRGAMGVVYKAYDPTVGRMVALKTVRLDASGSEREELIQRLRQEAHAAGRLEHPNIITVYDAGEAEGLFYLAMQFVKGRILSEMIGERTLLPVTQIVLLLEQVCDGLGYAHERGIVHRDLKPSNIIIAREGIAKIVDFGVAKIVEGGETKAGVVLGTPSYMSPEQAQGGRVDRRSDIFSLGAIAYELLTGEKAFPGNTPTAIVHKIVHDDPIPLRVIEPGIDPAVEAIVRKALAKDPFKRYQSCQELEADLYAFRTGKGKTVEASHAVAAPKEPAAAPAVVPPAPVARPRVVSGRRRLVGALAAPVLWAGLAYVTWQQDLLSYWPWVREAVSQAMGETSPAPGGPAVETPSSVGTSLPNEPSLNAPVGATPADSATGSGSGAQQAGAGPVPPNSPTKPQANVEAADKRQAASSEGQAAGEKSVEATAETKKKTSTRRRAPRTPALSAERQDEVNRWFLQAEGYAGSGRYDEAIFALEQLLRIDPKNQRAQQELERVRQMQALRGREAP
ncbi:MAG: protein kinase [Acidobacteria bacterium]|nr:protein kinase [Acidobacteriota bacterium]